MYMVDKLLGSLLAQSTEVKGFPSTSLEEEEIRYETKILELYWKVRSHREKGHSTCVAGSELFDTPSPVVNRV